MPLLPMVAVGIKCLLHETAKIGGRKYLGGQLLTYRFGIRESERKGPGEWGVENGNILPSSRKRLVLYNIANFVPFPHLQLAQLHHHQTPSSSKRTRIDL